MSRNFLYLAIGALAVVGIALGYQSYQEQRRTDALQIDFGDIGISAQSK